MKHGEDNKKPDEREALLDKLNAKEVPEKKPDIVFSYRNQYGEIVHGLVSHDEASTLLGQLMTLKHNILNKSRDLVAFIQSLNKE